MRRRDYIIIGLGALGALGLAYVLLRKPSQPTPTPPPSISSPPQSPTFTPVSSSSQSVSSPPPSRLLSPSPTFTPVSSPSPSFSCPSNTTLMPLGICTQYAGGFCVAVDPNSLQCCCRLPPGE